MVKYDKKNKLFKDFDKLLEEIMECDEEYIDDDSLEMEAEDASAESLLDVENDSETESVEIVDFIPGQEYSISNGRLSIVENSEDFPREHEPSEMEFQMATEQLRRLSVVDRKEYNNTNNIIKPDTKKKLQRRCKNIDD